MNINGNEYFYITNLQGDIIELVDIDGNTVVKYKYDAWGNIEYQFDNSGVGLAEKNPYRYRGYRFDEETGYYYLNSRYYNPEIGRFINADGQINGSILGNNLYTYCENNPVMYVDYSGNNPASWAFAAACFQAAEYALLFPGIGQVAGPALMIVGAVGFLYIEYQDLPDSTPLSSGPSGGSSGTPSGKNDDDGNTEDEAARYEEYWKKNAPDNSTPGAKFDHYKNNKGVSERSKVIYDKYGRQRYRIDYNNHGRIDHSKPHLHEYIYDIFGKVKKIRWDIWRK